MNIRKIEQIHIRRIHHIHHIHHTHHIHHLRHTHRIIYHHAKLISLWRATFASPPSRKNLISLRPPRKNATYFRAAYWCALCLPKHVIVKKSPDERGKKLWNNAMYADAERKNKKLRTIWFFFSMRYIHNIHIIQNIHQSRHIRSIHHIHHIHHTRHIHHIHHITYYLAKLD